MWKAEQVALAAVALLHAGEVLGRCNVNLFLYAIPCTRRLVPIITCGRPCCMAILSDAIESAYSIDVHLATHARPACTQFDIALVLFSDNRVKAVSPKCSMP